MSISKKQVVKSVVYVFIAAILGGTWIAVAPWPSSVVVAVLCVLAGAGLSLPGVSAARVAGGTVGLIVAKNAPPFMRQKIMDVCVGEDNTPEADPASSKKPGQESVTGSEKIGS
jgi:hypothetical protein